MPGKVRVLYFANARDATGKQLETVQLDSSITAGELLDRIVESHPGLKPLRSSLRLSVNREVATDDLRVRDGDEVAVLPPVAGG